MKVTKVRLCLEMALRDFAAFEDLAIELGVEITDTTIVKANGSAPTRAPRVILTPKLWDQIRKYPKDMTALAIRKDLQRQQIRAPAKSTIARIRCGDTPRPGSAK